MTMRRGRDLEQWMTAAASGEPAPESFVTGLHADQDAVTAHLPQSGDEGASHLLGAAKPLVDEAIRPWEGFGRITADCSALMCKG
jgi:hypothetical protein